MRQGTLRLFPPLIADVRRKSNMKKITLILNWSLILVVVSKISLLFIKPSGDTVVVIGGEGNNLYPENVFIPDPLNYLTLFFYILLIVVFVMNNFTLRKTK